jgi:ABC-2 type transport system permease protein
LTIGTLVAVGLSCLGLLISAIAGSSKVSFAVSLLVLLALFAPTQVPALSKTGFGDVLLRVNPIGSALHYVSLVLVNRHGWTQDLSSLKSPVAIAVLAGGQITLGPRIVRLSGGVSAA